MSKPFEFVVLVFATVALGVAAVLMIVAAVVILLPLQIAFAIVGQQSWAEVRRRALALPVYAIMLPWALVKAAQLQWREITVAEDWRVDGEPGEVHALELVHRLHGHEADLPQRVAVSRDGGHVFVYADTQDAAAAAARELQQLEPGTQWHVMRWHHEEEEWEDAGVPLPSTAEEHAREHERLEEQETAESQQTGLADWEIRVEFPSHHEAKEFAEHERDAGMAIQQRWKYVLIGFNDQDDAEDYGGRLRSRLPADAVMHVEPGEGTAWELMPRNPFAVFGGLGT